MKKLIFGMVLAASSASSFAVGPGGDGCGWGNMLFEGKSGLPFHFFALTTNGTTGNATFGMTSGTNGCSTNGTLTYGGKSMLALGDVMDEFSEDVARGDGEVLSAFTVSLGVEPADRAKFKAVLHENFNTIFSSSKVTTEDVLASIWQVVGKDKNLAKYVS